MVLNSRDRNIDSSRREDSRKGQVDRCEVIAVHPHVSPYSEGDKDFNTVDVQLIDRPVYDGSPLVIKRTKLNCLQHYHGLFQGNPWNPRIGDQILVYWLNEREGIVIGSMTSAEQEPVCRSQATSEHQELVCKRSPWEMPERDENGNFIIFPPPKHPDCFKWWPLTRDYITIHDCPYGHSRPECDAQAPCNCLDDLQEGTWWKIFSDISPTTIDKPRRVKFHHHCGSVEYWDEDGRFYLKTSQNARIECFPDGHIEVESPLLVKVKAPQIILDGNVQITGNLQIDGQCSHNLCSCMGSQDLSTFTKADPNNKLTVTEQKASCSGMTCGESAYICEDLGEDYFEDSSINFNCMVSACSGGACGCCGMSNANIEDILLVAGYKLVCQAIDDSGLKLKLILLNGQTVVASDSMSMAQGKRYSCNLRHSGGAASLKVYDAGTLVDTLSIANENIGAYQYMYGLSSCNSSEPAKTISCQVENITVAKH